MRAGWLALILAGCPAARPETVVGPEPRPEPATPPDAAVAVTAPPAPAPVLDPPAACAGRSWLDCGAHAEALLAGSAVDARAGMGLYRALCEAGDAHGCFANHRAPGCAGTAVAAACFVLGQLYEAGRATCPVSRECAAGLYRMACAGGNPDGCTASERLAAEE